jgi:hypothetical protein
MYQEDQIKSKHAVRTWQINNVSLLRAYIQSRDSIYGVERNFVCLWRRPNCRSQVIGLSLSALTS